MDKAELIVKVLLCHPTPAIESDPEIAAAKKQIKDRYREIKKTKSFSESEIEAKVEWLRSVM